MSEPAPSLQMRYLQAAAYIGIVAWLIRAASHILYVVLIALLFAYVFLPVPNWLMHRFRLRKSLAIALTVVFWAVIWLALSLTMYEAGHKMVAKAPIYEERITNLDDRFGVFLSAHGVQSTKYSIKNLYSHERIFEFVRAELPNVIGFFSDRVLVFLLGLGFLVEMAHLDSASPATSPGVWATILRTCSVLSKFPRRLGA